MTKQEFTTMVEKTIATVNYNIHGMDTEKYADSLYEDYNIGKKDETTAMRIYAERIVIRILRECQIVADYQYAASKFEQYGMGAFVTAR